MAAPRWKLAPTRCEQEKWNMAAKSATGSTDVMLHETKKPRGDPKVLAAEARERYLKLKRKLQSLTLGVGGIGIISAYFSYSPEIAASFGAGFIGSLVYIRMLRNNVDSMAGGARGILKCISPVPINISKFCSPISFVFCLKAFASMHLSCCSLGQGTKDHTVWNPIS
ncbi:hypothetical protein IFM89_013075 [Coptis chinensis]|uniref:CGL160/ATPI domain-containing protein n=1 Tax=Coptis chinensis TaxID=261450 RepID=A0A835HK79_9MAGN|nr:hypothetical protein IFM89_013075 [Coptis chinensis]